MIVCHCNDVHERAIKHAITAGARDIDEITDACAAGGNCQGCWPALEELLAHHERPARVPRWRRHLVASTA